MKKPLLWMTCFVVLLIAVLVIQVMDKIDRIPQGWDTKPMVREVLGPDVVPLDARILMWKISELHRFYGYFYSEECIVWFCWQEEGKTQWELAYLYRNPKESHNQEWTLPFVHHRPQVHYKKFDYPPTNAEIEKFLEACNWQLPPSDDWHLIDGEVCAAAWRELNGKAPLRSADKRWFWQK